MPNYFVVQAQSKGLYGDPFAAAYTIVDERGVEKESNYFTCPVENAQGLSSDCDWINQYVLPNLLEKQSIQLENPDELCEKIWLVWLRCKQEDPLLYCASSVAFPIVMNIFSRAILKDVDQREALAPYPLLEIQTAFLLTGYKISGDSCQRQERERLKRNPLHDSRYYARLFCEALHKIQEDGVDSCAIKNKIWCGIDAKSIGLWGDIFYFGSIIKNIEGNEEKGNWRTWCSIDDACGRSVDMQWSQPYRDSLPKGKDCKSPKDLVKDTWTWIKLAKEAEASFISWCPFPVDYRAIRNAVAEKPSTRPLKGIYPIHDLATVLYLAGKDPVGTYPRLEGEEKHGDPRGAARMAVRLLFECIKG